MDGQEQGAPGTEMWGQLVIDTLTRPRAVARQVIDAAVPQMYLLQGALLVACLGMVVNYIALQVLSLPADPFAASMLQNPLVGVVQELALLAGTVFLTVRIGRLFGGTGRFWEGLAVLVWLNVVGLLVLVAQIVVLAILPSLDVVAMVVAYGPLFWLIWVYANFVAELHGFQNPFFVLGAMILAIVVLFFAVAMLLTMLGFTPPEVS